MKKKPHDQTASMKSLQEAFEVFNAKTEHLADAYERLQKRASEIDKELERKNIQLNRKNIQLKDTTRYLESLLGSMPSALVAISGDQVIKKINTAASRLFGIKEKNVKEKPLCKQKIFKPLCPLVESSIKGSPVMGKEVFLNIEGKVNNPLLVEVSMTRMLDKNKLVGVLIIIRDMTELKDLRDSAVRNENLALLGQMAVTVAHEIRNPLGGVQGFASLLQKDLKDDPKKRELADKILLGTKDLNSFITDLLDFARPLKLVRKEENILDVVDKAIMFSLSSAEGAPKKIRIKKMYSENSKHLIDGHLLYRMLLNILLNAYESMEGRGTCTIQVSRVDNIKRQKKPDKMIKSLNYRSDQPFLLVSVKDSGPGIERPHLDEIFKPFVTDKSFGTGLGLSMVQKIIEAFNGRMDIITAKGKGAAFKIYVPIEE